MAIVKAVRGTRDLLPPDTELWNRVEAVARSVFSRYGFGEIRTPIFEATELFARGVGEETDIVSKEMFSWMDGERFDKERLRQEWLLLNPEELCHWGEAYEFLDEGKIYIAPIETEPPYARLPEEERKQKYKGELFDFVERLDDISIKRMLSAPSPHPQLSYGLKKTLVVASSTTQPDAEAEGIRIHYVRGVFSKSSQSLTLRPENTAGVVRAYIEHKLDATGNLQKLYYIGPQFRRERPQKGRYRQFVQIGAEVIGPNSAGSESPVRDAEILEMLSTLLDELGVKGWQLDINSVGSSIDRPRYVAALKEALGPVKHMMCEDNQRRAETNPLRVLDSKDENDQEIINNLPKIADFLDAASTEHFAQVRAALDASGVPYRINPRLVRGLDYYTRTTFEFTVPSGDASGLGTQNALLGGGRYDGLSEMLGGPRAPGIGFAIGADRLILTLQAQYPETEAKKLDAYIAPMGVPQNAAALALARELRRAGLSVEVGDGSFRLKKSFEAADKVARRVVILGEDEVTTGVMTLKTFATGEQVKIARAELIESLR